MDATDSSSLDRRQDELDHDLARWPARTKQLILDDDPLATKVAATYEQFLRRGEFDELDLFIDPTKICIDVGTNYGQYSMRLALRCKGCLAIEPVSSLAPLGSLLPENCVFRNVAAGATRTTKLLRIPHREGALLEALSTMADHNRLAGYEVDEQMTDVVPVDDLIKDAFPGEAVGFIKIDVEGFESEVLEGCMQTLEAHKPNIKIELYGNASVDLVCNRLQPMGYRGLFFFERRLFDASQFDLGVHRNPKNEFHTRTRMGMSFNSTSYVTDFFFVPAGT